MSEALANDPRKKIMPEIVQIRTQIFDLYERAKAHDDLRAARLELLSAYGAMSDAMKEAEKL